MSTGVDVLLSSQEAKGVVVQASAFFSFSSSMVSGDGNG
jgi:hypothetical protein